MAGELPEADQAFRSKTSKNSLAGPLGVARLPSALSAKKSDFIKYSSHSHCAGQPNCPYYQPAFLECWTGGHTARFMYLRQLIKNQDATVNRFVAGRIAQAKMRVPPAKRCSWNAEEIASNGVGNKFRAVIPRGTREQVKGSVRPGHLEMLADPLIQPIAFALVLLDGRA